ncbi:MAG: small multi-drug export protein [Campylobacterota bacterium]|nr:small multi-drug export protein [Campylobacterota bacterium]
MKINHTLLKHTEGKLLMLGLLMLGGFLILLVLCALFYPQYLQALFSITVTNVIFGRMAGLSIGVSAQIDTTILVLLNFFIESVMVLIFYPLFVLSWKKLDLISYEPLKEFLAKSKKSAHTYEPLVKRYGVIGLIVFVLTPFAMTGPVVGSFVGFLIGFKHRVTLFVVLLSTLIAIIIWIYLIKNFETELIAYKEILITGLFITMLGMFSWYMIKKRNKYEDNV